MDYRNLLMRLFWHEYEMLGFCDINESIEEPSRAAFTEEEKAEVRKLRDEAFSEWLWASHGDRPPEANDINDAHALGLQVER